MQLISRYSILVYWILLLLSNCKIHEAAETEAQFVSQYCKDKYDKRLMPTSCLDLLCAGETTSGVYTIYPSGVYVGETGDAGVRVWCDQKRDGGGWTVVQRRQLGNESFNRDWSEYKSGFGRLESDLWLGNDNIASLTNSNDQQELRIDLVAEDGERAYALYDRFMMGEEITNYYLNISGYSGNAGDSLISGHHDNVFSTKDRMNYRSSEEPFCDFSTSGGWWFRDCNPQSNLNGGIGENRDHKSTSQGVIWSSWTSRIISRTEMKIRINLR